MIDPVLVPFVAAATEAEANAELARLLEAEAAPVIARVLRAKLGGRAEEAPDLASSARAELIEHLLALRKGGEASEILNFRSYVAAVTYNIWAQDLRAERPARAILLNRLRYLFENRTAQRGFAIWDGPAGERWCGFEKWRTAGGTFAATPRSQWLTADPTAAARDALASQDWSRMNLADLTGKLFSWVGGPLELREIVSVLSELLEISDEKTSLENEERFGTGVRLMADPAATPHEALKWQEYLRWLWKEIGSLSLPQRTAFLLHSAVTVEFDFRGIASVREIAAALEIAATEFAALWPSLPLNDLLIAARLQLQRQQVINLRRVARDRLGTAWEKWIN